MELSKTELKLLEQLSLGNNQVSKISNNLKKDISQTYRLIKNLTKKKFIFLENNLIKAYSTTHVQLLLQELSRQPSFITDFSSCGIKLFSFIKEPKTIDEIVKGTKIKRSTIFYKFKEAKKKNLIKTINKKYCFNKDLWQKLYDFLLELEKFEQNFDLRVPAGSIINYKNDDEIIFSTKQNLDATKTGFSEYSNHGLKIYPKENEYYLPKRKLSIKDIFLHSLYKTENEKTVQNLILISLYYLKHKKYCSNIKHDFIKNINKVLKNEYVEGYPSFKEIKEKAELYGVEVKP